MKTILTFAALVALLLGIAYYTGFLFTGSTEPDELPREEEADDELTMDGETWQRHVARDFGVQFAYRTEPNGYILEERNPSEGSDAAFVKAFILMLEEDYEELMASTDPREGPPFHSINIYSNSEDMFPEQWARENPQLSNINLILGEVSSNPVAGAQAARYRADGLYVSDNAVVAHGGFIYVISGSFLEQGSTIQRDFEKFLDSVEFIPLEGDLQ